MKPTVNLTEALENKSPQSCVIILDLILRYLRACEFWFAFSFLSFLWSLLFYHHFLSFVRLQYSYQRGLKLLIWKLIALNPASTASLRGLLNSVAYSIINWLHVHCFWHKNGFLSCAFHSSKFHLCCYSVHNF